MRTISRLSGHPDIGENGRQPYDNAVSWTELRRPEICGLSGSERRAAVANTNRKAAPTARGAGTAAFGQFDR